MLRDLLSHRWLQICLVFFIIAVGGSLLYRWHTLRVTERDMERHDRFLQRLEKENETRPAQTVNVPTENETPGRVDTSSASVATDTETPKGTATLPGDSELDDVEDVFLPDDFVAEDPPTEEVPVSPHGFGPYPEVPEDFPRNVNWAHYEEDRPIFELMTRVQIKLWNQGYKVTGMTEKNGLMYPTIRGTVYVKWSRNGEEILGIRGHPADLSDAIVDQMMESGIIPAGLKVIDYETAGIDPYQFLNL